MMNNRITLFKTCPIPSLTFQLVIRELEIKESHVQTLKYQGFLKYSPEMSL